MELRAVSASDVAEAFSLSPDECGRPDRVGVAACIREILGTRRVIGERELISWLSTLCLASGCDHDFAVERIRSTLTLLIATMDIGALEGPDGLIIAATPPCRVNVTATTDRLLGDATDGGTWKSHPTQSIIRTTAASGDGQRFSEYLGVPSFREEVVQLDLPGEASLREVVPLLMDLATRGGHPVDPTDIETIAGLGLRGAILAVNSSGTYAITTRVEDLVQAISVGPELAGWVYLSAKGFGAWGDWPSALPMPKQLLKALCLCGRPTTDALTNWVIDSAEEDVISNWLGIESFATADMRDEGQDEVVSSPVNARLLVRAGPGSGKTWTACRRVSHLVKEGVAPSRIFLISFTRAAVSEIRERIETFLEDPTAVADISILTLDALAWRLVSAFDDQKDGNRSFDGNIQRLINLLKSEDRGLIDYLSRLEHIIVDEAQDLTDHRRELVMRLVAAAPSGAGVTIFHDPAQSIYAFTSGAVCGVGELGRAGSDFREVTLRRDYRTQSESLRALFTGARQILTDASHDETATYHATREAIEAAADAAIGPPASQYIGPADGSTFLLFRTRAEATAAANDLLRAGRDFRMRLPRGRGLVEPWVAAVIGISETPIFSRAAFESRLRALSPIPIEPQDELWGKLRRVASDRGASIDLRKLSELVEAPSPPMEITRTDIGSLRGPLLSTIHAAKGREADTVHLMMPRVPERPDTNWLEEARVLFVGATRARRRLRVGSAPSWLRPVSSTKPRLWQRFTRYGRRDALVEVGLESDVDVTALMDPLIWGGNDPIWEIQERLWRRSSGVSKLRAVRVGDVYDLQVDGGPDDGAPIGRLSRQFTSDLWTIGEFSCDARVPPPSTIRGIYMISARTVASEAAASSGYRFWLAPVLAGVPLCHFDRSR